MGRNRSRIESRVRWFAAALLVAPIWAGNGVVRAGDEAADCHARWAIHGVALGTPMQVADDRLSTLGARERESETPTTRQIWIVPGDGPAERVVVDAAVDGETVGTVLHVVVKPSDKSAQLLERYQGRWGAPEVSRHVVAGDRPGSMTEASVWIDEACDVKATLLVLKERTPWGFDVKRMGVRLERLIDPLAHLSALRDLVRDPPDR